MIDCNELRKITELRIPAGEDALRHAEVAVGCRFPDDYRDLLKCSNGLAMRGNASPALYGPDGDRQPLQPYTIRPYRETVIPRLYAVEELESQNGAYEVRTYLAAGWLLIGDDGGDRGFYLDCSSATGVVYLLGLGTPFVEEAHLLAPSLSLWAEAGFRFENDTEHPHADSYPDLVDIYLIRRPAGGSKALLDVKKNLQLDTSLGELYQALESTPYRLLNAVPFWRYAKACARYNERDPCLGLYAVDRPDHPIPFPE